MKRNIPSPLSELGEERTSKREISHLDIHDARKEQEHVVGIKPIHRTLTEPFFTHLGCHSAARIHCTSVLHCQSAALPVELGDGHFVDTSFL